jgi:hypothetical protein
MSHRTITCFQHLKENGKGEWKLMWAFIK